MRGQIGCPCDKCKGAGTIHLDLKAILEAIELLIGSEIEVTSGYRCPEHNKAVGGAEKSRHMGDPNLTPEKRLEEKIAFAVDFWPKDAADNKPDYAKWSKKAFTFHALVKPWFSYSYINRSKTAPWKWSIHGQIV